MTERIVAPRLADIIEAIERIRRLDGVTLEASNRIGNSSGWLSADLKSVRSERISRERRPEIRGQN